jgi:uncharacterized protein
MLHRVQSASRADWFQSEPGTSPGASASVAQSLRVHPRVSTLCLCCSVLASFVLVVADTTVREGFRYVSAWDHLVGSLALYTIAGTLLGLLVAVLAALEWWIVGRWVERRPGAWQLLRPAFYGLVGGAAAIDTARWTFSGEKVQDTALADYGPPAFCVAIGLATFVALWLFLRAARGALSGRHWRWLPLLPVLLGAGALGMWIDLTQYVMLYQRVHTIVELSSTLCFAAAFALLLLAGVRRERRVTPLLHALAIVPVLWTSATGISSEVRLWMDEKLRHVWLEEAYVGRMLWRFQIAEAFLLDPGEWRGLAVSRIERLRKRYNLKDVSLHPRYKQPLNEPAEFWNRLATLRGGQRRYDVVVYYVDTLRQDVASDRALMPNAAAFADSALDFTRAYATGSDTLRSLPALTGGNYDSSVTRPNDLLKVARRADYESVLVIAKSASVFLSKLRPEFHFDRTVAIQDYPEALEVWGYGAQQPTAKDVVDQGLAALRQKRDKPLFLWLFNFDQHNWRELDGKYLDEAAARGRVADEHALPWRYRVVASSIDEQFGRLMKGLADDKRENSTIVLFVSDHGESLGRDGFWVHSVFLWEPLIRVPLRLKAPGLPARRIDAKVSLVDVAPTLARYMDPMASTGGYQGEDLLGYLVPNRPARRYPLLLQAASKDVLVRVGMIDPLSEYKLVLSLEASFPELYDLRAEDPDARTVTREQPARTLSALQALVRSPVFPRTEDDFDVRDTKEQKALAVGKQLSVGELD